MPKRVIVSYTQVDHDWTQPGDRMDSISVLRGEKLPASSVPG